MARPTTILVVDDEPAIRRLLRTSLDGQGFSVVEAGSGAEALQQIKRETPDLLILDLGLPDVSGIEVIRSVRVGSSLPIIVLSVRDDERGKVEALDLGADDYVTKPFGTEELVARIRTALRHRFQAQGAAPLFVLGELAIDLVHRIVRRAGSEDSRQQGLGYRHHVGLARNRIVHTNEWLFRLIRTSKPQTALGSEGSVS